MNVWRPIVRFGEFTEQVQARSVRTFDIKAHVGVGVHQHVWKAWIWNPCLKPGNIMITKSGTKLLDFGLA